MKKIMKLIIAVAIVLISSNSFAQKFYVKLNGGYNFASASFTGSSSNQSGNTTTYERYQITLGKGFNFNGSIGYMLNKYLGAEVGANYLTGGETTKTDKSTNSVRNFTNTSSMLSLVTSIVFTPGFEKINPYAKFGLIVGLGSYTTKFENITTYPGPPYSITDNTTTLYNGGIAIGLVSNFGVDYKINDHFSVLGEISLNNLSYAPTKREVIESKENGKDVLASLSTRDKITEYSESYTEENNVSPDKDKPSKGLLQSLPFSSFGLNIGVKYSF